MVTFTYKNNELLLHSNKDFNDITMSDISQKDHATWGRYLFRLYKKDKDPNVLDKIIEYQNHTETCGCCHE